MDENHNAIIQTADYKPSVPMYLGYNASAGYFTFNEEGHVTLPQIYRLYEDPADMDVSPRQRRCLQRFRRQ